MSIQACDDANLYVLWKRIERFQAKKGITTTPKQKQITAHADIAEIREKRLERILKGETPCQSQQPLP